MHVTKKLLGLHVGGTMEMSIVLCYCINDRRLNPQICVHQSSKHIKCIFINILLRLLAQLQRVCFV